MDLKGEGHGNNAFPMYQNERYQAMRKRKLSVIQETTSIPTLTFKNSDHNTSKYVSSDRNESLPEAEYAQVDLINVLKKKRSATLSSSFSGSGDDRNRLSTKRFNGSDQNAQVFTNHNVLSFGGSVEKNQVALTADICTPKNYNLINESLGFSKIRGKQVMSEEASRCGKSEIFDAEKKIETRDVGTLTDDIYHSPPDA